MGLWKSVRTYWVSVENNIFKNYLDALLSILPLVILPIISLFSVFYAEDTTFWNYTFPIVTLSVAGIYDTYGRYEQGHPKNVKLGIRAFFDILALCLSGILLNVDNPAKLTAPALLFLSGIFLMIEVIFRVKTKIQISCKYHMS